MDTITIIILVIIAIIGFSVGGYIYIYNKLQKYKVRIQEAESEIDETLRKRHDLLLSMEKEINTFTELEQNNFKDFESDKMSNFDADRRLTKITDTFKKIKEDFPDKLDTDNFRNLSTELKIVIEKSDAAKAYYNKFTTSLNMLIKKFPSNLISRIHNIDERFYFDNKNMNDKDILDFKI